MTQVILAINSYLHVCPKILEVMLIDVYHDSQMLMYTYYYQNYASIIYLTLLINITYELTQYGYMRYHVCVGITRRECDSISRKR